MPHTTFETVIEDRLAMAGMDIIIAQTLLRELQELTNIDGSEVNRYLDRALEHLAILAIRLDQQEEADSEENNHGM